MRISDWSLDVCSSDLITHLLHTSIHSIGLTPLIRMLGENSSPPFPGRYHMAAASIRRREIAGKSIQRARRVEMESIARRVVLPLIKEKIGSASCGERVCQYV